MYFFQSQKEEKKSRLHAPVRIRTPVIWVEFISFASGTMRSFVPPGATFVYILIL